MSSLQLWGGYECTVNRVRDRYFDQTVRSGHQDRIADLGMFAELGVRALRYPVLWERVSRDGSTTPDFAWSDERLTELRRLNVQPIVGLIHHGSGPAHTNLLADSFAPGLANHAAAVAERYPWIDAYTPVNEPLTTARFSCLYGFWYPHVTDEDACWLALLNQIDATRLSMRAVRRVNPSARLVQTEDLGFAHATPEMAAQAAFENHRRWMTWDLLCGMVVPGHPLWDRLLARGFGRRLRAIADDPCPPDVIGMNHYLSGERFIDHRTERYPDVPLSSDAAEPCVNVDALRTVAEGPLGIEALIRQAWERYGRTIAITECHNGCTRDEQMRWFERVWRSAERARAGGVKIEAVTAWSLLGAYDWNKLVTDDAGHYECGVFDLRGGNPRPTAMAGLLKALAAGEEPQHAPMLAMAGWWEREDRFTNKTRTRARSIDFPQPRPLRRESRPILITGKSSALGQMFASACELRGLPYVLTGRATLSIDDPRSVSRALASFNPAAVINAAGLACIERSETEPDACQRANTHGPEILAQGCERAGIALVTFSSDQVFDGTKGGAYDEGDATCPVNHYGRSKARAEALVLAAMDKALVLRTTALFSPGDPASFATAVLDALHRGQRFSAGEHHYLSPTHTPDLAHAALDLLMDREFGIWHLANQGRKSWAGFARSLAESAGLDASLIEPADAMRLGWRAPRPADVAMGSRRGIMLPRLDDAIERFVRGYVPPSARSAATTRRFARG